MRESNRLSHYPRNVKGVGPDLLKAETQPVTRKGLKMHEIAVRNILEEHSKLPIDFATLENESDLYVAGLTSLTTVNVMLAIEDHFDVEFDDAMLSRSTFQSINSLVEAVEELLQS